MFSEIEFKFNADNIKLKDFHSLMSEWGYASNIEVSSWDKYYTNKDKENEFIRFRMSSDRPELTKKVKTKDANNWNRIEVDLPLDPSRISEKIVDKFVGLDSYSKNFKIFKSCFIYFFNNINAVWYIVSDENMKEQARFIEIEVEKDYVEEIGEDKAFEFLKEYENKLIKLGVTPQNRMKKSLFEIFVKK